MRDKEEKERWAAYYFFFSQEEKWIHYDSFVAIPMNWHFTLWIYNCTCIHLRKLNDIFIYARTICSAQLDFAFCVSLDLHAQAKRRKLKAKGTQKMAWLFQQTIAYWLQIAQKRVTQLIWHCKVWRKWPIIIIIITVTKVVCTSESFCVCQHIIFEMRETDTKSRF